MVRKKLSEIAQLLNGYAFKSTKYVENGIRVIRISNVQDGYIVDEKPCFYPLDTTEDILRYRLVENDLLVSLTGNVGRVGILPKDFLPAALNQRVCCIRIKDSKTVNKNYLYYFLRQKSFVKECIEASKGVAQLNLSTKWLEGYTIPVPPLPEQERIVARIEELFSQLDAGVETLKKTKTQLATYRQAVLKEAFDSVSEYNTVTIESLCQSIVDCPHSTPKWTKDGCLCLRTTNFKRGRLDLSEKNYVTRETFDVRNARLIPLPGDILYSREGAILGIACIIPEDTYVCLGQRMMLFRPCENLNNRYLMYYLNSPTVTSFVASITGGSASPHVNVRDIKAFMIPYPDIRIQKQIVAEIDSRFSICDNFEQTIDVSLKQAESMRQSILKDAFEGRL